MKCVLCLILLTMCACNKVDDKIGIKKDNVVEQAIEQEIEQETGVRVDFTPDEVK